ncbi:MAG: hypothetical protein JNL38_19985 [Myxococcales bacterium]|nr:hypothetical protein [Myxococcales bacterium]
MGFVLRMLALAGARNVELFSHQAGGDGNLYEEYARIIAHSWERYGIHYVTMEELPDLGRTSLPPNLFGLIIYLNGGPTVIACTALTALTACLTLLNFYALAKELGAEPRVAERIATVILFAPSFMLYTSDMYKDGLVWFFTLGAVGSAFRLSRKLSVPHAVFGIVCLVAVWYVRYYLVFVCVAPLLVGFLGIGSKSPVRVILTSLVVGVAVAALMSYSRVLDDFGGTAQQAYDIATSKHMRGGNALGGSGVTFDDGGKATGALPTKLVYTLFAPFPWQGGSFGLHVGKIDTFMWYYFMYRSVIAARRLWRENRALLIGFASFMIPLSIAYATSMANIGLILRQRMPVVLIGALLASLSWPKQETAEEEEEEAEEGDEAAAGGEGEGSDEDVEAPRPVRAD